ncbi:WD40 repeat domain-containing protein [Niveibacterium sp. 24ML]|uniref:WD40 repeat domain-containing protein n=1 Tax=Niveibacterium sp. 24ML TaxID=2985512 RepID=UPI0022710421|nr:WD40 repeat domain-containing protein [Niveibacterium sp. 24ML]MCX9154797.1 WD40 repeat domain-containing protein [Niveibacterium sp. 24ML]
MGLISAIVGHLACAENLPAPDVRYVILDNPNELGLGFLWDNKTLYVGGCRTLDVERGVLEQRCRYPENIKWGHISPDGSLLLATTIASGTSKAISYQIDAQTGRIQSSHPGMFFSPPVAVHPSNQYWAVPRAGKTSAASETVSIVNRSWRTLKSGIYAGSQRLFSLQFSPDGSRLIANGGDPDDGAVISTATWQQDASADAHPKLNGLVAWSPDHRFGFRVAGKVGVVIDLKSQDIVAQLEIDMTDEEPQAAFSSDSRRVAVKGYRLMDGVRRYSVGWLDLQQHE